MESAIHIQVLAAVFAIAVLMGAVANKTSFCTMGAVSDWVNMGDLGRMRAWLLAIALALGGVTVLEATGTIALGSETFPPYRTGNIAWLRYVLGGLLFGIGMTLGSGCGNKTLVRVGGGNLKSLVVLAVAAIAAYGMLWTPLFERAFLPWIGPGTVNLAGYGIQAQDLGALATKVSGAENAAGSRIAVGAVIALAVLAFVFASREFRQSFDNILGGAVIGLAVVAGWWITAGPMGRSWKEWAEMATEVPSRVQTQSYTFISPMGDIVRWIMEPTHLSFVNFGIVALLGVIAGSFLYSIFTKNFRFEWFRSGGDAVRHVVGGLLMGVGGVLAMGCTVGQAITGVSTLALGSIVTFVAIVAGAAATMKYEYWRMMREA